MSNRDSCKTIDVVILCGGLGKRLGKIAGRVPKPMIKMGKKPFLDILVGHVASFGFKRFVLCTGYKADVIERYYRNRRLGDKEIVFSRERNPLGTGGAVKHARRVIRSDNFLVLNGDSYLRVDFKKFLSFHINRKALISMVITTARETSDYGVVRKNDSHRITGFKEKAKEDKCNYISGGIYLFRRSIFSLMPKTQRFSLEEDFFPQIIKGKEIYGYIVRGKLIDIGTPRRYKYAADMYFKHR